MKIENSNRKKTEKHKLETEWKWKKNKQIRRKLIISASRFGLNELQWAVFEYSLEQRERDNRKRRE